MDLLLNTDFPDIRVKSFIQSKEHGAIMTIPREGGYLCRFYVEINRKENVFFIYLLRINSSLF